MLFHNSNKIPLNGILALVLSCPFMIANADDSNMIMHKVQRLDGQPKVVINSEIQATSGLKTLVIERVEHRAEFEAMGKVISIQPLLALRERYLVAQAELNGARSRFKQVGQSLKRQQELFRHGIAAKRSLQEQEAIGLEDKASVDASYAHLTAIANEAQLTWGKELAKWALSDKNTKFKAFLAGKQHLLHVILPTNKQLGNEVDTIAIALSGQRSEARPAVLISRSVQTDNAIQGESYFFQAAADGLPFGTKVTAWIPYAILAQSGVIIPESALVWHMDQVYAYIKIANDTFARRLIKKFEFAPEGYFVDEDLKAGEEIVVTGGQMLLSEELRGQIPDED